MLPILQTLQILHQRIPAALQVSQTGQTTPTCLQQMAASGTQAGLHMLLCPQHFLDEQASSLGARVYRDQMSTCPGL